MIILICQNYLWHTALFFTRTKKEMNMKKIIFLLALSTSINAFANSELITLDAFKICPNLKSYTYGYNVDSYTIENCINKVDGNKFQEEAALICLNLPFYSRGYYVSGFDVVNCFEKISNKTYSDGRINYCKNLKNINAQNQSNTSAIDVYNCLK